MGEKPARPASAHWSRVWDGRAGPTYLTGHHLPLAKALLTAPAQLLWPDLFFKPVVSLLIGPDLLQLDLVFHLASFFSAVSILGLLLILESRVAKLLPSAQVMAKGLYLGTMDLGGTKVSIIGLLVEVSFGYSCAFSKSLGLGRTGLDNLPCKNKMKRDSTGRNSKDFVFQKNG